ncbi:ribonuclease H-like protein [Jaminaea rosea]|uniref:ribonuclease H n=1 Tax=Jaminaea rosea TaxID=1569628 RepID=A0A316URX6_9BASI|nr:ribonuclease H-like protein [Jaminaea rosea]PWN25885.1 ribonuclease H-like protein [Jaminaea rosea]
MPPACIIYTDGACVNNGSKNPYNPGESAFGVCAPWGDRSGRLPADLRTHTSQNAELYAIYIALRQAPYDQTLLIRTDSSYSVNTLNQWCWKWRNRGGYKSDGNTPANWGLVQAVMGQLEDRRENGQRVHIEHVRGHAGFAGNERAHDLAQKGLPLQRNDSPQSSYDSDSDYYY